MTKRMIGIYWQALIDKDCDVAIYDDKICLFDRFRNYWAVKNDNWIIVEDIGEINASD